MGTISPDSLIKLKSLKGFAHFFGRWVLFYRLVRAEFNGRTVGEFYFCWKSSEMRSIYKTCHQMLRNGLT